MKNKLKLIILFAAVWNCNGHLRILGDILSSAHDRIHSTVENAAGTLLGGISHGLNFNAGGHFGVNGNKQQPSRPDETIVVVIKEEDNNNNFRPPNPNFRPPHHNNGFGNQDPYRPNNPRPNYNVPNNGNNFVNRPNYGNRYPDNQYNGNQNNYNPNYNQGGNNYGPPPNKNPQNNYNNGQNNNYNDNNYNNNANNYNNNYNNNNGYKPVDPGYNQVQPITNHNDKRPDVPEESPNEYQTKKPDQDVTTSKPVDDDAPLFIPLNDYNYGGDKINITAPKRDTNSNNKAEEEDEDFGIDVRIKDT